MTRRALLLAAILVAGPAVAAQAPLSAGAVAVVLPFDNPDAVGELHWMREGAALLATDLLRARGVDMVGREARTLAYERLQLPVAATLSRASAIKVGYAVGAAAIVTGRLARVDTGIEVRARVIRLDSGRMTDEVVASGPPAALFDVVTRAVDGLVAPAPGRAPWAAPPSLEAFELFTRGLAAETPAAAQAYFDRALAAAPAYDAVRLALWDLHTEQGAHAQALKGVAAVGATSALYREARYAAAMSHIALEQYREAYDVLRALQQGGALAAVSNAIGVVQFRRGGTPQTGTAVYYFNQATELDPSEEDYFFNLGYAYWQQKDANGAVYWLREAVRRDPADGDAHLILSAALQQMGAGAESTRERELAARLSSRYAAAGTPIVPRGLERLHTRLEQASARVDAFIASAGQRDQAELARFHLDAARRAFDREADAEAIRELRRAVFLSPYLVDAHVLLGRIHLRGGRPDEAIQALKIAVECRDRRRTRRPRRGAPGHRRRRGRARGGDARARAGSAVARGGGRARPPPAEVVPKIRRVKRLWQQPPTTTASTRFS
ncbi:MAG: tetratricopeptide repeat protein [Vicinamibacterales bacterium]